MKKISVTDCIACALALAVMALFGSMLVNCHPLAGDLPAPCDALTLTELTAECRTKVRAQCARSAAGVVDPECPIRKECRKRVDEWHDCKDAGPDTGAAGAKGDSP